MMFCNTLPDREMARTKGVATDLWGRHVNLSDARLTTRPVEAGRRSQGLADQRVRDGDRGGTGRAW